MKKLLKILSIIVFLIVGTIFGDMVRKVYFTPNEISPIIVSQKPTKILSDTLPLGNAGKIEIQLINDKKMVIMSFADLEYITQKRKKTKLAVESLKALFHRLKDKLDTE